MEEEEEEEEAGGADKQAQRHGETVMKSVFKPGAKQGFTGVCVGSDCCSTQSPNSLSSL